MGGVGKRLDADVVGAGVTVRLYPFEDGVLVRAHPIPAWGQIFYRFRRYLEDGAEWAIDQLIGYNTDDLLGMEYIRARLPMGV